MVVHTCAFDLRFARLGQAGSVVPMQDGLAGLLAQRRASNTLQTLDFGLFFELHMLNRRVLAVVATRFAPVVMGSR